jgi:hypothetical protein
VLVNRTDASHDRVFQQLQKLRFNPKSANDERVKRFLPPKDLTGPTLLQMSDYVNQALGTRLRVKSIAAILCHFFIPNAIMRKWFP